MSQSNSAGRTVKIAGLGKWRVQRQVAVIVTPIGTVTALAAKTATPSSSRPGLPFGVGACRARHERRDKPRRTPHYYQACRNHRLGAPAPQELLPCEVNQRAWWSRITATACAPLSTQHGISMSCGLASSNPGRDIFAFAHSTRPLHIAPQIVRLSLFVRPGNWCHLEATRKANRDPYAR